MLIPLFGRLPKTGESLPIQMSDLSAANVIIAICAWRRITLWRLNLNATTSDKSHFQRHSKRNCFWLSSRMSKLETPDHKVATFYKGIYIWTNNILFNGTHERYGVARIVMVKRKHKIIVLSTGIDFVAEEVLMMNDVASAFLQRTEFHRRPGPTHACPWEEWKEQKKIIPGYLPFMTHSRRNVFVLFFGQKQKISIRNVFSLDRCKLVFLAESPYSRFRSDCNTLAGEFPINSATEFWLN